MTRQRFSFQSKENVDGSAAILFLVVLFTTLIVALSLSQWTNIQRRGDVQMRASVKETNLVQSAIGETRLRLLDGPLSTVCSGGTQTFRYTVDNTEIAVRVDCAPVP